MVAPLNRYRILSYPWHTGTDYELAKLPHDLFYLANTPRQWALTHRPIPPRLAWVPSHRALETDVMLLHLDQWTELQPAKRYLFEYFRDAYDGPKIAINYGCNLVDGCTAETMRDLVAGCAFVCNSETARREWRIDGGRVIRHGYSPDEWLATNYERNNVVVVHPTAQKYAAYANFAGIEQAGIRVPITWIGRDVRFNSFAEYQQFLQTSSIYFQPSYASPNPRARDEAMLTGLAIVTTNNHGESDYIENDVNGYASNDFEDLIEYLEYLLQRPAEVRRIGEAGRQTAQESFHIDNLKAQWQDLLDDVLT